MNPRVFLAILLFSGTSLAVADAVEFASGPQKTVMIELFTSQGCSSCPPAEAYLNSFVDDPQLWTKNIPAAFHVDYWDYLGWKDRFAHSDHARRQQRYARLGHVGSVYTPALIVNGKGRRPGRLGHEAVDRPMAGNLKLTVDNNSVSAGFMPAQEVSGMLILHLAVLGMNLATDIQAGENAGHHSRHEFVVLGHRMVRSTDRQWQTTLPDFDRTLTRRLAVIAWLSRPDDPAPLQATGGYLP